MTDKFDRFTKRARRTLMLAQEEAEQLQHPYIGSEHLLLGMLGEERGVAALALAELNLDVAQLRQRLEQEMPAGRFSIGKLSLTPRVKRIIELALGQARGMGHHYIGTEHLLLGLLSEGAGLAYQALTAQVSPAQIRDRMAEIMGVAAASTAWSSLHASLLQGIKQTLAEETLVTRIRRVFGGTHPSERPIIRVQVERDLGLRINVEELLAQYVKHTLAELPEREARVLLVRLGLDGGQPRSPAAVAEEFGVTPERIRQIETKILSRLSEPAQINKLKDFVTQQKLITTFDAPDAAQDPASQSEQPQDAQATTLEADIPEQVMNQIYEIAAREERNRLARDLHDSIKQQIFSISVSAAAVAARWESDPPGARAALNDIQYSAQAAMVEMNALLQQLRPNPLETVGLLEAIREQCEALEFRTGAQVTTALGELPSEAHLPKGVRETIFRIVQEALSNIARHARATQVKVQLTTDLPRQRLRLDVQDNGQGFDPATVDGGMGLANMRERVSLLGGELVLESAPDGGTTIQAEIPLMEGAE